MGAMLSNGFRFNGIPQKLTMTGLTVGKRYTLALYSQAWGSNRPCVFTCSALEGSMTVNQDHIMHPVRMDYSLNVLTRQMRLRLLFPLTPLPIPLGIYMPLVIVRLTLYLNGKIRVKIITSHRQLRPISLRRL